SADADSKQFYPTNTNAPVSVGGDCGCGGKKDNKDDPAGNVTQLNISGALAAAGNKNSTDQSADQTLDGSGSGGGTAVQAIGQLAVSKQDASADADSTQWFPTNTNTPVSVGGGGGGGDVTQANVSAAAALAGNKNEMDQSASQDPKGNEGTAIQAIGQVAFNKQDASADADSTQVYPTNTNAPVSVGGDCGCGGKKDDKSDPAGSVTQVNFSGALAAAGNKNSTDQSADQT